MHRASETAPTQQVIMEADTSGQAVRMLREQLPQEHQILFLIRADPAGVE